MAFTLFDTRNVNSDLYPRALSNLFRNTYRLYDLDYALAQDPDAWEKVRRDPIILQSVTYRVHQIAGTHWTIEPASDRPQDKLVAEIIEQILKRIERFQEARMELAEGVITARTYQMILGGRDYLSLGDEGSHPQWWWIPGNLKDIDRRRVRFVPEREYDSVTKRNSKIHVKAELFSIEREAWELLDHPEWLVKFVRYDRENRTGYGEGLLNAIYFYSWAKDVVLEEGLKGLERWAQGIVTAKIDGLREASPAKNNATVRDEWLDVIHNMRSRHALVYDKADELDVKETTGTGHQMVTDFLHYFDDAITRLISGALLPMGGGANVGSNARSVSEAETQESVIQFDRSLLDEVITRDLIGLTWRLNKSNFANLGLGDSHMPHFKTVQQRIEDPEKAARVAQILLGIKGVTVVKSELMRKVGFSIATPGDDVIEGGSQQASLPLSSLFPQKESA